MFTESRHLMESFIFLLFLARDLSHREHLRTNSYAQHTALGSFYGGIIEKADAIAEAYQGKYGLIKDLQIAGFKGESPILATLEEHVKWIDENRNTFLSKNDTTLQNMVDDILALYLSTIYKLKFLN